MEATTLKQLAEVLDGNYWEKGNLKRVYLDRGYNTKKMSTKTFVFQDENGEFKVSCKVDCPSQPWEWCNSQEEQIKKSVQREIEDATATEYYFAKKKTTELYFSSFGDVSYEKAIDYEAFYSSEQQLLDEMDNCAEVPEHYDFITIDKAKVDADVKKCLDEYANKQKAKQAETEKSSEKEQPKKKVIQTERKLREFTVGDIYTNPAFGNCLVTNQDDTYVHIQIQKTGEMKKLLRRFAKLDEADNNR